MIPDWFARTSGAELDALRIEGNWGAVKRYITQVLQARGLDAYRQKNWRFYRAWMKSWSGTHETPLR